MDLNYEFYKRWVSDIFQMGEEVWEILIEFATKIFRITGVLNNDIPSIPRFTISIESDLIFFKGGKRCSKKPDASNRHPSQPVHRRNIRERD